MYVEYGGPWVGNVKGLHYIETLSEPRGYRWCYFGQDFDTFMLSSVCESMWTSCVLRLEYLVLALEGDPLGSERV